MKRRLFWFLPGFLVAGLLGTVGGYALGDHAEAVFLRQQDAQSRLASALAEFETAHPALAERLYSLEDELHSACRSLREAGKRRLAGETLNSGLEWAIMTSLNRCQLATGTVETVVQQAQAGEIESPFAVDTVPAGDGDR